MDPSKVTRSLAAVLVADVTGYSRLMERDESGTHARLRDVESQVLVPTIERHEGRIVKTAGDGYVVEFSSATAALRCAVDVQKAMAARNASVPADDRIRFRVGINVADILHYANDVAGSGVNLAARLEALAEPGGICISQAVREQVIEDIGVHYLDAGMQRVKNLQRPVRVFRVLSSPPTRLEALRSRAGRLAEWKVPAIAASAMFAAVASYLLVQRTPPAAPDAPEKLSVAVLPFSSRSDDRQATDLAAALGGQLYLALSPERHLLKVKRLEPSSNAPGPSDLSRLRGTTGARYVVMGEVSRDPDGLTVDTRLIDTGSAAVVWGDRVIVPAKLTSVASVGVAQRLSNALHGEVFKAEVQRQRAAPARHPDAMDLVLKGYDRLFAGDFGAAGPHFESALRADPRHVPALLAMAYWVAIDDGQHRGGPLSTAAVSRIDELTLAAVKSDPSCADSWTTRSTVLAKMKQTAAAAAALERALGINPFNAWAEAERDALRIAEGRAKDVIRPLDDIRFLYGRSAIFREHLQVQCRARILSSSLDDALDVCGQWYVDGGGEASLVHLIALHGLRGEQPKAADLVPRLAAAPQPMTLATIRTARWQPDAPAPQYAAQLESTLYRGLKLAGVPER